MKNKNAFMGMIFGAGIGIIFSSTGLGLPIGAGVGLIFGLLFNQQKIKKKNGNSKNKF
ncbi:hypothetical protein [Tenacibaculum halocynthiae]|uniref:hypothetical protein n=1 Tax=Tenacibaculum halocynthiae TaxID=1254437 RepID=UPI003893C905